jgi:hypothetical protein
MIGLLFFELDLICMPVDTQGLIYELGFN